MKQLTLIDCFCGAGGLSLGFAMAGFNPIYAFDINEKCIETYRYNLGKHAFVEDAYSVSKKSIKDSIGVPLKDVDVIAGGPPCQGFSVQRRGSDIDPRNNLVNEYLRIVLDIRPRLFLMENVGGLLSVRGKPYLNRLIEETQAAGYSTQIQKLDAYDFGVPQHRKRVFIVGNLLKATKGPFEFPVGNRSCIDNPSTVREAIQDLMFRDETHVPNHRADKLSPVNIERIRAIKEGEGRDSLPEHLQLDCHINNEGHRHLDVYGRMSWDKPSPTITARFDSFSRGRFGHPQLDRTITLREGARLQSFPDNFVFFGPKVQVAYQIGNAVPPLVAKAIAEKIKTYL